jgi:hypothetical protein
MSWKTIRLELAGTRDFPAGSVSRGFLIRVPLDDAGSIDESALAMAPQKATVRRFWSTEPDRCGRVVRANGHWAIQCGGDAESIFSIDSPSFALGEQVALVGRDGMAMPFRVAGVHSLG